MKKLTVPVFVDRLEKMLDSSKDNCDHCPCNARFILGKHMFENGCETCKKFMGVVLRQCPCDCHGKQKATTIARQKIKEWRENNG